MKLWMIIGVPGSGKTTTANKIANNQESTLGYKPAIFEADMYFIDNNGKYNWRATDLYKAHNWCYSKVEEQLQQGKSVIVANTFIKAKERKAYIQLIKKYNAELEVITCTGHFKNIHNVPAEKVLLMLNRFQPFSQDELN